VSTFEGVEQVWLDRLGNLRNTVRQHLVRTQLHAHLDGVTTALDVGCGQGTQALALAARGIAVTGLDPSRDLLAVLEHDAAERGCAVETIPGGIDDLHDLLSGRLFDLACAHGVLMYLPDAPAALATLAGRVRPGGRVSFTVRNGDALALRPALRGDWPAALAAFDATTYVNELGARALAHRLDEVLGWCGDLGLEVEDWYGVRVLTDARPTSEAPDGRELGDLLAAEVEAGRRDPYRRLASQLHVIARRA
jgi:S-adenosylmethionine-dependent methyltransferase